MDIPIPTKEQLAGVERANAERKRMCEQVLVDEKLKKQLKQTTPKPIRRKK